ncbi:MAG TPA: tetratricopeptide repeat protein [Candidatus Angelobacter sp.]|nr:tetratricopeptide repeat protein [Candidatus Angelobacter sp.]
MKRLNRQLTKEHLGREEALRKANEWVAKYRGLERELNTFKGSPALVRKAKSLVTRGEFQEAEKVIDQLLVQTSESTESAMKQLAIANLIKSYLLDIEGNSPASLTYLERAYQYDPHNLKYGILFANKLADTYQYDRADLVLHSLLKDQVASTSGDNALDLLLAKERLALLFLQQEKCNRALSLLDDSVEQIESDARDRLSLLHGLDLSMLNAVRGNCYARVMEPEKAAMSIETAIVILQNVKTSNPEEDQILAETLLMIADYYWHAAKDLSKAEGFYLKAIRQLMPQDAPGSTNKPDIALAFREYANFLRLFKGETAARTYFDRSVAMQRELAAKSRDAYTLGLVMTMADEARSFLTTKEFTVAIAILSECQKSLNAAYSVDSPSSPYAIVENTIEIESLLGHALLGNGNYPEALEHYRHALDLNMRLLSEGDMDRLQDLVDHYLVLTHYCAQAPEKCSEPDALKEEITTLRTVARIDPSKRRDLLLALLQRATFYYNHKGYRQVRQDAEEAEAIGKELLHGGIPERDLVLAALGFQLQVAQANSDDLSICSISSRILALAADRDERESLLSSLPPLTPCSKTTN